MALTDQPYLPLYVDDWMNNNKLKMCSVGSHGLLISIMCIMHKEETYGKILLKQKYKQTPEQKKNFALQLARLCAFDFADVEKFLNELLDENVLQIDGDFLLSKRMVRDAEISEKRKNSGKKGGIATVKKKLKKSKNFAQAKFQANTGNENENEIVNENGDKEKGGVGEKENVFPLVLAAYDRFIYERTGGPAKIDAASGKAAKDIIAYLRKSPKVVDDDSLLKAWEYVLKNWGKLTPYQAQKIKLVEISADINKIFDQFKNNNSNGTAVKKPLASTTYVSQSKTAGKL